MSERASYTTEYIYCQRCFEAVRAVFGDGAWDDNNYTAKPATPLNRLDEPAPIVCGAIYGTFDGSEYMLFEFKLRDAIEPKICHPVRVVITWEPLAEAGSDGASR